MGKKINPLAFGLMGFATGFANALVEEFKTERARKAKALEMAELRQMALQDREDQKAFRREERAADVEANNANREDTQAFNADQRAADAALRRSEGGADRAIRASEGAADRGERAKDREAQRELQREISRENREAAGARDGGQGQLYKLPGDQTTYTAPFGQKLPQGAIPAGTYGISVDTPRPGRAGLPGLGGSTPSWQDGAFSKYGQ